MITAQQATSLTGRPVVGRDGEKIGEVGQVFLDDETGQPEWATAQTGLFGTRESFVPLAEAELSADALQVPYAQDQVEGAPSVDADGSLSQDEEARLYSYYGLAYSERASDSGLPAGSGLPAAAPAGRPASDSITLTRSVEELRVGVQRAEVGRARLRKFVVTEQQSADVPVAHDEVRITREPIDADDPQAREVRIEEAEHEVVLTAQRAVVDKEVVPVERIALGTRTVQETVTVGDAVRKEEVELIDQHGVRTDVDSDPTA